MALSRRAFIKLTGVGILGAPTIIPSSILGNEKSAPPSERVTLGHIGVGGRGSTLLEGFEELKDVQSVAVSDCFKSRREAWADRLNCKAYADFRDLLARGDIDAVVIATPDHWHAPIALAAARSGKDMYVEKPLGVSVEQDQIVRRAVRKHRRIFQYGTQQRSIEHCRFGCELVRNGRLGEIHTIEVVAPNGRKGGSTQPIPVPRDLDYDRWLGPAPKAPYTKDRCTREGAWFCYDYALGFIAGWGAHPLDILQWGFDTHLAGDIEVAGTGDIPTGGLFDTVINWDVSYVFENGVKMTLKAGDEYDATKFMGSEGWVSISRSSIDAEPKSLLKATINPHERRLMKSPRHDANFIDCIKKRKTPVSSIEDAVRSDVLSHLGDIAIRVGRKIHWDPQKEAVIGDEEASRRLQRSMRAPWTL